MKLLGLTTLHRRPAKALGLFLVSSSIAAAGVAQAQGSGDLNGEIVLGLIGIIGSLLAMLKVFIGSRESFQRHETTEQIHRLEQEVAELKRRLDDIAPSDPDQKRLEF